MNQLASNVYKMSNPELIGLAKNRWLPETVQMAIAKFGYRRAHEYLCLNSGLAPSVRDHLWSDECNKGYSLKCLLLQDGHYAEQPDKYIELYEKHPSAWTRSPWRVSSAFLGRRYYYSAEPQGSGCPPVLLNRIYDEKYKPLMDAAANRDSSYYLGYRRYDLETMAQHSGCDLVLAIKLSTCGSEEVQRLAFKKIVELSQ